MALPSPFEHVDDRGLAQACIRGDEDALVALERRFGRTIRAVGHRVAADHRAELDITAVSEGVFHHLRRNQFGPLRTWTGTRLAVYLSLVTREVATQLIEGEVGRGSFSGRIRKTLIDDLLERGSDYDDDEPTDIEKLSPVVSVMLRLRLHGLGATGIAVALGTTRPAVLHQLGLIAQRLGHGDTDLTDAYRCVLGHAGDTERVLLALRSESQPELRAKRRRALATWEEFRERAVVRKVEAQVTCLSTDAIAGLVDGSLRGPSRAQAEGHVGACAHCADRLALLVTDQAVITPLRESARHGEGLSQLATAVSTLRPELVQGLLLASQAEDPRRTRSLVRIARTVQSAELLGRLGTSRPPAFGAEAVIPTDDEAPIVALEALIARAPSLALEAVDDHLARRVVGRRLRLLASATLGDLATTRLLAREAMERSSPDPELVRDVDVAVAVPEGAALPLEVLADRLRTLVPDVVRYVVDLGR